MHSTALLVFPIILWLWDSLDLQWLLFVYLECSRLFSIWILWCQATDSSSAGRTWRLSPLTNRSCQLTFHSVTSHLTGLKLAKGFKSYLEGEGKGGRHTQRNCRKFQFSSGTSLEINSLLLCNSLLVGHAKSERRLCLSPVPMHVATCGTGLMERDPNGHVLMHRDRNLTLRPRRPMDFKIHATKRNFSLDHSF